MKFDTPKNPNYSATVVRITSLVPLTGCDNVVGTPIFGMQAIVGKGTKEGDLGIVFPAESQLSDDFCRENNMYRHNEKNKDIAAKGYIEDSRRVKAVKFRGHMSSCLFMPLSSLKYLGIKVDQLAEGDTFDQIKGKEICRKYVLREPTVRGNHQPQPKRFNRVDTKFIPEHFDTENYFRNDRNIGGDETIIVTQKLHGTSIRIANTIVARKLSLRERVAKLLGVKVQETEHDYVYGSRKVIKDVNNPYHNHFYTTDIWSTEGEKLKGLIPENFIVYAELVGYTADGAAIQADYTYNHQDKTCSLFIYRVAFVNGQGIVTDLDWDRVKAFCKERNLKHVPELWRGKHEEMDIKLFLENKLSEWHGDAVEVGGDKDLVDEGVCIRTDRYIPYILKAKSQKFLEHETKMLDKEVIDLEASGSNEEVL